MQTTNDTLLYTEQDKLILKVAEDSLDPKIDRLEEVIAYAKQAKHQKIGIAHCVAFNKEALFVKEKLEANGLEVAKVDCKHGRIPFSELVDGYKGVSCNPAGQANYLAENNTELNIMMGLCVGHDMIFNEKSKVPVTPLVVKDRKLKHKTIDILK